MSFISAGKFWRIGLPLCGIIFSLPAQAELLQLDDCDLADVSGQGGIYLSGDVSINEVGGPVQNSYFGSCSDGTKKCGARLAYQLKEDSG